MNSQCTPGHPTTAAKRILIYSHDTFGLGNIRRTIAIANYLVDTDPNTTVLILSGSPVMHSFRLSERIDYVKLPCLTRTSRNMYKAKYLDMTDDNILSLRTNIIRSTVNDYRPDLILIDKKPFGVANELVELISDIEQWANKPKMVLLLRDILDSPAETRAQWRHGDYDRAVCEHYNRVLVVGQKSIFDISDQYGFSNRLQNLTHYCGYLRRRTHNGSIPQEITHYRTLGLPIVLVAAGGGEDGYQILTNYLKALPAIHAHSPLVSLVFCGPELAPDQHRAIKALGRGLPHTKICEFTNRMEDYVATVDMIVSMGGYNTVCEILSHNKPAIIVPRLYPVAEQTIRAQRLQELGMLTMIEQANLSPDIISRHVVQGLDKKKAATNRQTIDLQGLHRIRMHINELLSQSNVQGKPVKPDKNKQEMYSLSAYN